MSKEWAQGRINALIENLHTHVNVKLKEIEEIANEHGIIVPLKGLPPFDDFGNSGYYFPLDENGVPWYSSDIHNDYYPVEGPPMAGWLSSDVGC